MTNHAHHIIHSDIWSWEGLSGLAGQNPNWGFILNEFSSSQSQRAKPDMPIKLWSTKQFVKCKYEYVFIRQLAAHIKTGQWWNSMNRHQQMHNGYKKHDGVCKYIYKRPGHLATEQEDEDSMNLHCLNHQWVYILHSIALRFYIKIALSWIPLENSA